MKWLALALALSACTEKPVVVKETPPSVAASSAAPDPSSVERGKPHSGWGVPGECINCPPTGCPSSCASAFKR